MTDEQLSYAIMDIIDSYDGAVQQDDYLAGNSEVCESLKSLISFMERVAVLNELQSLKKIDCFNEAYTSDPRPAKYVDRRIQELSGKQD